MLAKKFEQQVEKTPGNIAVKDGNKIFTYNELNRYANRIARLLGETAPGETVGLLFEHGAAMIAAILGTLKAGKIYVPLSGDYPPHRLAYMLSDSASSLILTDTPNHPLTLQLARETQIPGANIDTDTAAPAAGENNPVRPLAREKIAYILYTSGSTGKPKGVSQTHENADYYNMNWVRVFSITPFDRMTLFSSFCHDGAVQDMFSALHTGAALYPFNMKNRETSMALSEFLTLERMTIWHSVPSLFGFFAHTLTGKEIFKDLRFILLGGEPVREHEVGLFNKYFPYSRLANVYGQTESSVDAIRIVEPGQAYKKPLLGTPLNRTELFVVDAEGEPVSPLETGEILVACPHISPGYWEDPRATAKSFSTDEESGRLYWTGDLGRLLVDGSIEFLGRRDYQVKIRGFRVELGEIETRLLKHPQIKEAVVTAREDAGGDKYLCAYVLAAGQETGALPAPQMRNFLAAELPDYMIPAYFVTLEKMPLTPTGKIDRKALPEPAAIETNDNYIPSRHPAEKKMVELWSRVLGIPGDKIGIDTDFFQLGGHSLKATILEAKVHKAFNTRIPLARIFKTPTIRGLCQYLEEAGQDDFIPIQTAVSKEYYPVSSAQQRLYILQQLDERGTGYNLPAVVELAGNPDIPKLTGSFKKMIHRHESLRTSFHMINGNPVQRIHREVEFEIEYYDFKVARVEVEVKVEEERSSRFEGMRGLAPLSIAPLSLASAASTIENFIRSFDLSRAPLLRIGLIAVHETRHIFMLDIHHIISDGISIQLFIKELMALYAGETLPVLRFQYKDYSDWLAGEPGRARVMKQEAYWLSVFPGEVPVLNLPYDFPRPVVRRFAGKTLDFEIDTRPAFALKELARTGGATLYMVVLAVIAAWLAKLSGQEDIVIGTPVAGRRHTDLERIMGMLVNTLALRNQPAADKSFSEFLNQLKTNTLQAFENQEYPFAGLVEKIDPERDTSRNPLFDVMFMFRNFNLPSEDIPEVKVKGLLLRPFPYERRTARFDLTITAAEEPGRLLFNLEYSTDLFKPGTLQRFTGYFKNIVTRVVENPGIKLSGIDILSAAERQEILHEFNDTAVDYPKDKTIQCLFAEQVERTPDNIAAAGPLPLEYRTHMTHMTYMTSISYRELNQNSHRLAGLLREKGVQADTIVGMMVERSTAMIIALLAILKAGGAYLPIDPDYPEERISYMLADSNVKVLLKSNPVGTGKIEPNPNEKINNNELIVLNFEHLHFEFVSDFGFRISDLSSSNLAYVIYTSGSTGKPKGVMIMHRAVVNFIKGITGIIPFNENDSILSLTTLGFDIFGLEAILPLTRGARVVIGTLAEQFDAAAAAAVLAKERITIFQVTPSRLQVLLSHPRGAAGLSCPNYLLVGGEVFPQLLLEKTRNHTRGKIYNMYGPTETTIWSTVKEVTAGRALNIGKPIANTRVYIVDKTGHLQPVGIPGDLLIGGAGTARGYINNPELTAERFFPAANRSYTSYMSYIIYRTGDLARWLPDGNIEFLGRMDHQVKIRGFRIELAEIEIHLQAHERIREAVVLVGGEGENKSLWAYVVSERKLNVGELQKYLSLKLPGYMIPSYFVSVDKIALTLNGKIDRKALIKYEGQRLETGSTYAAPAAGMEKTVAGLWKEVLKLDKVGIHDNFFHLGGNSLNIIQLNTRLREVLKRDIPVALMFRYLTIGTFTKYLAEVGGSKEASKQKAEVSAALNRSREIYENTVNRLRRGVKNG